MLGEHLLVEVWHNLDTAFDNTAPHSEACLPKLDSAIGLYHEVLSG